MTRIVLVPAAQTDWQIQGRLAGDLDVPLNETGHQAALRWARELGDHRPVVAYCGPEQATRQTAEILAHDLQIKVKKSKPLRELNLGHWEALTIGDIRERFPRVFKQWRASPESVTPPEGESLAEAAERLLGAVREIAERHPDATIAVVIGAFAYAILTCNLVDAAYGRFWDYLDEPQSWRLADSAGPASAADPAMPPAARTARKPRVARRTKPS